jgi:hypothetical protein
VPILPLVDLLLLLGTGSLFVGFVLKSIAITTRFQPTVLGFSSLDFVLIAGVCMGLALVLAARLWVKLNEPRLFRLRREDSEARFRLEQIEMQRAADALEARDGEEDDDLDAEQGTLARGGRRREATVGRR